VDHEGERLQQVADNGLRATGNLAEPDDALVGANFYQDHLGAIHALMGGPSRLRQRNGQWMGDDFGDLHGNPPGMS
jgi:hypothetical protein